MSTGSVKITGVPETLRALARVDTALKRDFVKGMAQAVAIVTKQAKIYPPRLPNQKYIRTYKLKRGWRSEKVTPTRGVVGNRGVPYAQYVQDSKRQAAIHAGRWNTEQDIAAQSEKRVNKIFNDIVKKAVK